MKNKLFIGLTAFFITGCQPIMMKMYGIKDPDVESEKTIRKKALKFQLDTSNIVAVNSNDFFRVLKGHAIPDVSIYDKNGKYIEYRQVDTSCNAGLFKFIPDLNLTSTYNQPDSLNLNQQLVRFRDLKGNAVKSLGKADFYVLIYWAVWTGKLNKDHVKIWEDLARANKNCKINVIKVNLDIQQNWEETERKNIEKIMSKRN